MLAENTYPRAYVDDCRAMVERELAAYRKVAGAKAATGRMALEPLFCRSLVLVLDRCFVHRTRAREGKDGNPMNEVRLLCSSILEHDGVFTGEKVIKWVPEASVLGYAVGDAISIDVDGAERLAGAFFDAIEASFT
ncbi:MAG: hypothetical protein ACHQIG_05605 [Acidimicrobiia bacterium]